MNIFYLDHEVNSCAKMHVDKHCVKMILEYAQLLSTAHRVLDGTILVGVSKSGRKQTQYVLNDDRQSILYSATHVSHPSAVWVRHSIHNYMWLSNLLGELCAEYTYRYGKVHKCERDGLVKLLYQCVPDNISLSNPFTEPTPAMPDEVKVAGDSIASYRNYYINNKAHLANWKLRQPPTWYKTT
jgi:hypothetical protein